MTGPEHYRAAERLVAQAAEVTSVAARRGDSLHTAELAHAMMTAEAQVHATLALAAVNDYEGNEGNEGNASRDWAGVA